MFEDIDNLYGRKPSILKRILAKSLWLGGGCLFFLMLTSPFQFYSLKILILLFLILTTLLKIFKSGRIKVAKSVFSWFVALISFGIFFSLLAFTIKNNNPTYILKSIPVNVVWPICYFFLLPFLSVDRNILLVHRVIIMSTIYISLYLIFAALSYLGILPISPSVFSAANPVIGKYDASIQLFLPSTTSLLFLVPFLITYLLLQIFKEENVKVFWVIAALLLSIMAVIITARRALILNLLLAPVLIYFFLRIANFRLSKSVKTGLFKLFGMFLISLTFGIFILVKYDFLNLSPLIELFAKGFDMSNTSDDEGSSIRGLQSSGLIRSWMDYPILGSGLGSASEYVIRSEATPWVYELSYLTLLFQTGIVGFIIYMSLLYWIFYKGLVLIKSNDKFIFLLPSLVGSFCFLLGNASNPYLIAFDHMWAIFLPMGLINYCYFNTNTNK